MYRIEIEKGTATTPSNITREANKETGNNVVVDETEITTKKIGKKKRQEKRNKYEIKEHSDLGYISDSPTTQPLNLLYNIKTK